jgi:hypothetical protein
MKKVFSIAFIFLILLSGVHFSIATHFCGGEVAAVKWSVSGKMATCGMENTKATCPVQNGISTNCCHNEIAFYTIDSNYHPSFYEKIEIAKSLIQAFFIPLCSGISSYQYKNSLYADLSPPDNLLPAVISQVSICVFRI